jgi:hypothetical protein
MLADAAPPMRRHTVSKAVISGDNLIWRVASCLVLWVDAQDDWSLG